MKQFFLYSVVERGVINSIFTFDLKWNYYTLALIDPEAMPTVLSQHELMGAEWWLDQQIIELDH